MHRSILVALAVMLGLSSLLGSLPRPGRAQEATSDLGSRDAVASAVLRFYDLFNASDLDGLSEIVAPDFVDHNPVPGQASGVEGLQQALALFRAGFPDRQITVDDVVVEGDKAVTRTTFRGTHGGDFLGVPPSGSPVEFMAIDIWRIEGGLIKEVWHIEDLLSALIQVGALPAPGAAATPSTEGASGFTVVASGLTNPRGMGLGSRWHALRGAGGHRRPDDRHPEIPPPLGPFLGGPTGAVARIVDGCPIAVVTGLPSSNPGGNGAIGIGDLAFLDGQLYALGAGGTESGGNPGTANAVYRIDPDGTATLVADLSTWALANPPSVSPPGDEALPNPGNPYAMVAAADRLWVVDAVLGLILTVTPAGEIALVADVSDGHPVPTGIALAPDGGVYVGYLTALPYFDGTAKVVHIDPDGAVTDAWTGLTAITSVAVGPDGTLYAAELSTGNTTQPPFIVPGSGRIVRQTGSDTMEVVADRLDLPVAVDVGAGGALYVSLPAIGADHGEGQIVRLDSDGATPSPDSAPVCTPLPETLASPAAPAAMPSA